MRHVSVSERSPISKIALKLPPVWPRFIHLDTQATLRLISKSPPSSSPSSKWPIQSSSHKWGNPGFKTHPQPFASVLRATEFRMCDHAWRDDRYYKEIIKSTCYLAPSAMATWLMFAHQWSPGLICWPSSVIKTLPTLWLRTWWETSWGAVFIIVIVIIPSRGLRGYWIITDLSCSLLQFATWFLMSENQYNFQPKK